MTAFMLHLLRHGAPMRPGRLMGRTDDPPSQAGIDACLARVQGLDVARLLASDLQRACRAGAAIGRALNLPLTVDRRWREMDFGRWDGMAPDEVNPAALNRFYDDPDAHPPPEGECWSALAARVAEALAALTAIPTLVVTHGGAMRAALHVLCGFDQARLWAFDLPYGTLLSLRVWPGGRPAAQIIGLCS